MPLERWVSRTNLIIYCLFRLKNASISTLINVHKAKSYFLWGGNSAVEYAIELSKTNNVTLNYRKDTFSRLNDINLKLIHEYNGQEKLRLRLGMDIVSVENKNGLVKVNFTDGYYTIYDRVVYAIGGTTPVDFLKKCGITI